MKYDYKKIETKWQRQWLENKTFEADSFSQKPKYYVLDMFPYPSGAGLHVGHAAGYTATDIIARFKRQKGFNVLHPMGWDAFGLPAEQYAVRTGTHPAITTKKNIDNYRRQLQLLGFSYDWDREFATCDSSYYKWTQWIFTKLFEKGLAYEAEMSVNYCPALGTVLANEEIDNGKSKEGGHPVEKRPLRQWVLKITAYAEKLIEDLETVDWPESLKKLQINWIGKSIGAQVDFLANSEKITVFTTRADTLFGATYLVLAPEHPLVGKLTTSEQTKQIKEYQISTALETEQDRMDTTKTKTGVFTGAYAINPVNGKPIPIWISDYVLLNYGTGAIMAVPAHDERDFDFAKKFDIPIIPVYDLPNDESNNGFRNEVLQGKKCWTGDGKSINSSNSEISLNGLGITEATTKMTDWLEKKQVGKTTVTYKLRDWLFSRQRYWGEPFPIMHFPDGTKRALDLDELPLCLPEVTNYKPSGDGQSPLAKVTDWVNTIDPKSGKIAKRETNTMPNWAGSCWYYLRFCDPHNAQEAWGKEAEKYWLPVDLYIGGVEHAVLHLLYARFWHKVLYDCGFVSTPEPFKTLRNQGLVVARSYQQSNGAYVEPKDVVERDEKFYHKTSGEPLRSQIDKMSKSKLNGVTPDEIIEEFGTDSLRLYVMFMGPLEKEKVWNTDAVTGCRRFLNRIYDLVNSEKISDIDSIDSLKLSHRLLEGVTKDTEAMLFNTAIAKMMEFINDFSKLPAYPKKSLNILIQCLAPYAPHLSEELWETLGNTQALSFEPFPVVEQTYLEDENITYVFQVNGKIRGRIELPKNQTQDVVLKAARELPTVQKYLDGQEVLKVIFVPNKLLNFVVK